jgi:hypothetical protein
MMKSDPLFPIPSTTLPRIHPSVRQVKPDGAGPHSPGGTPGGTGSGPGTGLGIGSGVGLGSPRVACFKACAAPSAAGGQNAS